MSIKDPHLTPTTTTTNQTTTSSTSTKVQLPPVQSTPLKLAILGNVDSGKSTLVGTLVTGQKDNSRGLLRSLIATHPHEVSTGRTSAPSHHIFGYDKNGSHVFYNPYAKLNHTHNINDDMVRLNKTKAWSHIITNSQRVVSLLDLAGHQKYLKTSISHLVSHLPDLALILVSPNTGLSKMTIEHFSLCVALRLRIVVLVTKIDRASIEVLRPLRVDLNNFITQQCQRTPITVKGLTEINQVLGHSSGTVLPESYVPIFYISSTTLQHFDLLHTYLSRCSSITWDINTAKDNTIGTTTTVTNNDETIQKNQVVTIDCIEDANNITNGTKNNTVVNTNELHTQYNVPVHLDTQSEMNVLSVTHSNNFNNTTNSIATTTPGLTTTTTITQQDQPALTTHLSSTTTLTTNSTLTNNATNTSTTTSITNMSLLKRDISVPSYLQPLLTGEMRIEEKFAKTNVGLIVSGTVSYGHFDTTTVGKNDTQMMLLGPFCARTDNNITSTTTPNSTTTTTVTTTTPSTTTTVTKSNNKKTIQQNEDVVLDVEFIPVTIKSIQLYRSNVQRASIGDGIGICIKYDANTHKLMQKGGKGLPSYKSRYNHLKELTKGDIIKGMVLIGLNVNTIMDSKLIPNNYYQYNKINPIPKQFQLKRYEVPYSLLLSSSMDIEINVLHPSSCFRQGYQIVLHCSSLVLPINIEKVLCVIDSETNTIVERHDNDNDHRINPIYTTMLDNTTIEPPINNDILLRHNQRGILRCRFIHSPYIYIHKDEQILLRDGSTRAIGTVSATFFK